MLLMISCQKADSVESDLAGTWNRVVFDHEGTEQWIFTPENKIYIILNYEAYGINSDTVAQADFVTEIVRYSHGTFFNKNILKVPQITISGFENYKYNLNQNNIYYPAYNTRWEVHQLDNTTLIITTTHYNNIDGGLEMREFYRE